MNRRDAYFGRCDTCGAELRGEPDHVKGVSTGHSRWVFGFCSETCREKFVERENVHEAPEAVNAIDLNNVLSLEVDTTANTEALSDLSDQLEDLDVDVSEAMESLGEINLDLTPTKVCPHCSAVNNLSQVNLLGMSEETCWDCGMPLEDES